MWEGVLVLPSKVFKQSYGVEGASGLQSFSPPTRPPAFQLLLLPSVPSKKSQVAGCSHPSWEQHRQLRET